jgi:hypothetical protein
VALRISSQDAVDRLLEAGGCSWAGVGGCSFNRATTLKESKSYHLIINYGSLFDDDSVLSLQPTLHGMCFGSACRFNRAFIFLIFIYLTQDTISVAHSSVL